MLSEPACSADKPAMDPGSYLVAGFSSSLTSDNTPLCFEPNEISGHIFRRLTSRSLLWADLSLSVELSANEAMALPFQGPQ